MVGMFMDNARTTGHHYMLHPTMGSSRLHSSFLTMVQKWMLWMILATPHCMMYHLANMTLKKLVLVLHSYYWSMVGMFMENTRTTGHHYMLHPTLGSSRLHSSFFTMVQKWMLWMTLATPHCMMYYLANMTLKTQVLILHSFY